MKTLPRTSAKNPFVSRGLPTMNNKIKTLDFPIPPLTAFAPIRPFLTLLLVRQRTATGSWTPRPPSPVLGQGAHTNSTRRTSEAPAVYAVDDVAGVTDLYRNLLEPTGYVVRAFNDRADALAALKADRNRPALLITDYLGLSTPLDP